MLTSTRHPVATLALAAATAAAGVAIAGAATSSGPSAQTADTQPVASSHSSRAPLLATAAATTKRRGRGWAGPIINGRHDTPSRR